MVDLKKEFNECLEEEYNRAFKVEYKLQAFIVNQYCLEQVIPYLKQAYDLIVNPMGIEIRQLMFSFNMLNEGELFCSNLQYKMYDDGTGNFKKYAGENTRNSSDKLLELEEKILVL